MFCETMNNWCVFFYEIFLFVSVSGYATDNKTKQHAPFVSASTYFRVDQLKVFLNNSPVFFLFLTKAHITFALMANDV